MRIIESINESISSSDFGNLRSAITSKDGQAAYMAAKVIEKKSKDNDEFNQKVVSYIANAARVDEASIQQILANVEKAYGANRVTERRTALSRIILIMEGVKSKDRMKTFGSIFGELFADVMNHLMSEVSYDIDREIYSGMAVKLGAFSSGPALFNNLEARTQAASNYLGDRAAIELTMELAFRSITGVWTSDAQRSDVFVKKLSDEIQSVVTPEVFATVGAIEAALTRQQKKAFQKLAEEAMLEVIGIS